MALQTVRVCDACLVLASDAQPNVSTSSVEVVWAGAEGSVDLCDEHAELLARIMPGSGTNPRRARKSAKAKAPAPPKETGTNSQAFTSNEVREWADREGKSYPKRGPIPVELMLEYKQAHS